VRETTQNIAILQIIDIVAFFQVEQSLFALSTLPFPGVSLQHTVLDRHARIGFTKSSIMECSSVISSLVLGQELSATLFESSLLGSAGITGNTFELSASDIVLELKSQSRSHPSRRGILTLVSVVSNLFNPRLMSSNF
jgi:hypothetical protein